VVVPGWSKLTAELELRPELHVVSIITQYATQSTAPQAFSIRQKHRGRSNTRARGSGILAKLQVRKCQRHMPGQFGKLYCAFNCIASTVSQLPMGTKRLVQELISRLDSRTLRSVNVLGLLVFGNNIKNGIGDIRDRPNQRRITACP